MSPSYQILSHFRHCWPNKEPCSQGATTTYLRRSEPAGVPVGGQFATNPKTEAALALPNYTKTTLGFAGVAVLDEIGVEPLPAWPVTLPDPSEPSYSWGDDGDLEVSICFGDDEVDIWGNHDTWSSNFEGVPEEFEHLSDCLLYTS